jgi:hypothetical protein
VRPVVVCPKQRGACASGHDQLRHSASYRIQRQTAGAGHRPFSA